MKLAAIVCGDRYYQDKGAVLEALATLQPDIVIEGEANGADSLAREACEDLGIPVEPFPADWRRYGRAAGPVRNGAMLVRLLRLRDEGYEVLVLAFHERLAASTGTKNMLNQAGRASVRCWHHY